MDAPRRLGTQLERRFMPNDFVPEVQRGGAAKTIVVKEIPDLRKARPAGQLEKYSQATGDIDALHFVGHAAPIPLLLQFANYEQYFDKTSMEHYVAAASEPKKVLYYDTGHDLNDPQALEDRYEWLAKYIHLSRR
jgi:hypothetical protein